MFPKGTKKSTDSLVICLPTESVSRNALYQRIVRQLVHENYPLCETYSFNSNHGMRVKVKDEVAEEEVSLSLLPVHPR